VIAIILIIVIGVAIWFFLTRNDDTVTPAPTTNGTPTVTPSTLSGEPAISGATGVSGVSGATGTSS
jgi:hypothetical protein